LSVRFIEPRQNTPDQARAVNGDIAKSLLESVPLPTDGDTEMANSLLPPALPDIGPLITAWQTLKNLQAWVDTKADFRCTEKGAEHLPAVIGYLEYLNEHHGIAQKIG
jgi:hypothetical protein